jgi:hypothetical protein
LLASDMGGDEQIQPRPEDGHLGSRQAKANRWEDLSHIPMDTKPLRGYQ